jgi:hypothetical protein
MKPAYIRSPPEKPRRSSAAARQIRFEEIRFEEKRLGTGPANANDHEQRARVHPALPSYSVVVPAPELLSIDVAVKKQIGTIRTRRKGLELYIGSHGNADVTVAPP